MVLIMFVFKKIKPSPAVGANKVLGSASGLRSGMTILELLVTVAVLALGLSAILGLQMTTIKAGMDSNHLTMASFIAESQHEWMRSMEFNRVAFVSQDPERLSPDGEPGCVEMIPTPSTIPDNPCFFTRTVTLEKGAPTTRSYSVSIKVQWLDREIVYNTVISDLGFS